jgi:major membrane immunogen (membrane-anchored lipoprotein)
MSMSTEIKKGKMFIKEVVGRLKGDDAEVKGAKIGRKAISAVEGQIAALKCRIVDLESTKENAEEGLKDALYPTEVFSDNKAYCDNIVRKQQAVDAAADSLDEATESLKYFEDLLATF